MRRMLMAVALMAVAGTAAQADCRDEVASALDRQRKTSGFIMQTQMLSEDGRVDMTVEYVLPDRMRQIIKSEKDPDPIETVLVGDRAWTRRQGEPWMLVNPHLTNQLAQQVQDTLGDNPGELGEFECLGRQTVEGKPLLAYQGENESGPKDLSPGAKNKPKLPNRPVRVIYVDQITGLPMRSIFARADKLDKPIFEATYSYPADIKIEAPSSPKG
jgi:hypothetical protein